MAKKAEMRTHAISDGNELTTYVGMNYSFRERASERAIAHAANGKPAEKEFPFLLLR